MITDIVSTTNGMSNKLKTRIMQLNKPIIIVTAVDRFTRDVTDIKFIRNNIFEIITINDMITYNANKDWKDNYGQLWIVCSYINGKRNGEWKSYHQNGQLKSISTFIDDKLNGEYKQYDLNGELVESCNYNNGKKDNTY